MPMPAANSSTIGCPQNPKGSASGPFRLSAPTSTASSSATAGSVQRFGSSSPAAKSR
ncbi:hypothetical protein BTHI11S_00533 [Bosea thiooxidans]